MLRYLLLLTIGFGIGSTAKAQVVMLPTQQQFSYRGSVLVPDGGSAYLGGVRRYASGSSRRGLVPFGSSRGSTLGNSGLSVSATIIDHQEIDRQLLGGTPQEFMERVRREREEQQAQSRQTAQVNSLEEGKALVRHARRLYAAGEIEGSRAAYRLALPLLNEQLRPLALAEYHRLDAARR